MTPFDEQAYLQLLGRVTEQWDSGILPPRHELARLLNQTPQLVAELIRTRQQLRAARSEAGTLPLLLSPQPQATHAHA